MTEPAQYIFCCNGAAARNTRGADLLRLECRQERPDRNVSIFFDENFPFGELPPRYTDLLEIAAYVAAAEILSDQKEFVSGSLYKFYIGARDYEFWNRSEAKHLLVQLTEFLSPFRFEFNFCRQTAGGKKRSKPAKRPKKGNKVTLFSGGLDSMAGAVKVLSETDDNVCLLSHQPGLPGVSYVQNTLYNMLSELYPGRCKHYKFHCGVPNRQSSDKTRMMRPLVYNTAAFAAASVDGTDHYFVFENGISAMNLNKELPSADRSTHPKALGILEELFSLVSGKPFHINQPFLFYTKADVIRVLKDNNQVQLLKHIVSCSRTTDIKPGDSHCGVCPACISRVFGEYAAGTWPNFKGSCSNDFLTGDIKEPELLQTLLGTVRQAHNFSKQGLDAFFYEWKETIFEVDSSSGSLFGDTAEKAYKLCRRHSEDTARAVTVMRNLYDPPWGEYNPYSFFSLIVNSRAYQRDVPAGMVYEGTASFDYQAYDDRRKKIPPRELKSICLEYCRKLIESGEIDEVLEEKKLDKAISKILIPELEKDYILSESNKTTISDYFRKGELRLFIKDGGVVVDTYPSSN